MNPATDYALTLVLLAPMLVAGAIAIVIACRRCPRPKAGTRTRLSDSELRRLYPILAERAGKFHAR